MNLAAKPLNEKQFHISQLLWRENAEFGSPQAKLQASESKLNSILSAMADFVFVFDSEGRFIFHHSPHIDDLYVSPDAFLGRKHSEIMPSRLHKPFAAAMERNKHGEVVAYEYWLEINNRMRWFSVKMSPVFWDGEFTGSVAVAREITEIKEMQRDLQQTHKVLE